MRSEKRRRTNTVNSFFCFFQTGRLMPLPKMDYERDGTENICAYAMCRNDKSPSSQRHPLRRKERVERINRGWTKKETIASEKKQVQKAGEGRTKERKVHELSRCKSHPVSASVRPSVKKSRFARALEHPRAIRPETEPSVLLSSDQKN